MKEKKKKKFNIFSIFQNFQKNSLKKIWDREKAAAEENSERTSLLSQYSLPSLRKHTQNSITADVGGNVSLNENVSYKT